MLTKIKNQISKMTMQDWITVGLWLLTFVLLLVFVILAATLDNGGGPIEKNGKWLANGAKNAPDATAANVSLAKTYSDVLAGVGVTFGISIVSALFTTVFFAKQKKGAK